MKKKQLMTMIANQIIVEILEMIVEIVMQIHLDKEQDGIQKIKVMVINIRKRKNLINLNFKNKKLKKT